MDQQNTPDTESEIGHSGKSSTTENKDTNDNSDDIISLLDSDDEDVLIAAKKRIKTEPAKSTRSFSTSDSMQSILPVDPPSRPDFSVDRVEFGFLNQAITDFFGVRPLEGSAEAPIEIL